MTLKSLFFPENKKFFRLFDELAVKLKEMSGLMLAAVNSHIDDVPEYARKVEMPAKTMDILIHKLFIELGRNYITPFNREDIHSLATGLKGIAHNMRHIIKQLKTHKIDTSIGITKVIAEQNHKLMDMLASVMQGLSNLQGMVSLTAACADIKHILYDCDNLLDRSISQLFDEKRDTIDVIKKMDHFEALQNLMEKTGDTINVIESVIIKYG